MKRTLQLLTLFSVLLMSVSCGQVQKGKLKMEVEAANKECPVDMGMFGRLTAITYDEDLNRVQIDYEIDEGIINIDALRSNSSAKKSLKLMWQTDDSKEFMKMIMEAGAKLRVAYKSSGKKADFDFSPSDIHEILDSELSEKECALQFIELQVDIINAQCPMVVDELTTMQCVEINDDTFSYVYNVDESLISMNDLKQQQALLKSSLQQTFSDATVAMFIQQLAIAGYDLEYRYVGSLSGEETSIVFTNNEL